MFFAYPDVLGMKFMTHHSALQISSHLILKTRSSRYDSHILQGGK